MATPCRFCGTPVTPATGEGFKLFRLRFVACEGCAPKVRSTATVVKHVARVAVRTAMAARAPQVLRVLDAAVDEAQGNPPPRVAEVTEVRA